MYNVDTISLGYNLEDKKQVVKTLLDRERVITDYKSIRRIEEKLKKKLYLDDKNRKKQKKLDEQIKNFRFLHKDRRYNNRNVKTENCVYWYGKDNDNGYSFVYNQTRHTFIITVFHRNIESYTADEILRNVNSELFNYFGIYESELTDITLRRIDYYADYRYRDKQELLIIKNIIKKMPERFRTYKKETVDNDSSYTMKYISVKSIRK